MMPVVRVPYGIKIVGMLLLALATLLAGCGKKGDLFLPEQKSQVQTAPAAPEQPQTTEKEEEKDKPKTESQ